MVCLRFAPSPTGYLHLGNARIALLNFLFARKARGRFLLRLDDTDKKRSTLSFKKAIEEDLQWLGIQWDFLFCQSDQTSFYKKALNYLKQKGYLYPCYETAEELEEKRKENLAQGKPPLYNRQSLYSNAIEGRLAHWRFLLPSKAITWIDGIQGEVSYDVRHLSDPVVVREDGSMSFLLSGLIDDLQYGITHVLRGSDHISNTAIQISMEESLGDFIAQNHSLQWAHIPLMTTSEGTKFSKRTGGLTLRELREKGILPLALCQVLTSLGTNRIAKGSLEELITSFSLDSYGTASGQLDMDFLEKINKEVIASLSYEEVKTRNPLPFSPAFWEVIAPNIDSLNEIAYWYDVCYKQGFFQEQREEKELIGAKETLPSSPWTEETWDQWVSKLGESCPHYTKKEIMAVLRLWLTGRKKGPQMRRLLPLMNPLCVYERLERNP